MDHKDVHFTNPTAVASYGVDTPRRVPGLADLHRMVMLLLAEQAARDAHILVVGAGGGMEIKAMAEAQPAWRFTGVDPSPAMLDHAHRTLAHLSERVDLIEGTIDHVPPGPYDGATCLLTLHHLARGERLRTLKGIHHRLRPSTRLVLAEHSAAGPDPERWLARVAAFADREGPNWAKAAATGQMLKEHLHLLTPAQEKGMLREAGYTDVELYYAAFSFRGWVGTAGGLDGAPPLS